MEVSIKLKSWKIKQDADSKLPVVEGEYSIEMNGVSIADQSFNSYSGKKIPFFK